MSTKKKLEQVLDKEEVRSVLVEGDIKLLTEEFNVSRTTVNQAINLWLNSDLAYTILNRLADNAMDRGHKLIARGTALKQKLHQYKQSA